IAVEVPKIGLVMENARVVRWLKATGERVERGEPLVELETEKSLVEVESTGSGRLAEILLPANEPARVGDRLAWLESDASESSSAQNRSREAQAPASAREPELGVSATERSPGRIKSSPAARRQARQYGMNLAAITGTGPGGRIQLRDVGQAAQTGDAVPNIIAGRRPLSAMRRAVARAMTLSNATVPQLVVERAVDWTAVHAVRARGLADLTPSDPRLSLNDFLLHACARSLAAFPALNAIFSGDPDSSDAALLSAPGTHVGLAVAADDGIRVPVFHDVDTLSLAELARRRAEIIARASSGRLRAEELQGATFSISNLGAAGPDRFIALIEPPQSAILAVGRQSERVIVLHGELHVRPISTLTLTVDHRVADGRLAAQFLAHLVRLLESETWPTGSEVST
ncbi:MAG TPA: dihydrolipoamide acetyltransferase family protein, partial [Steroidobacteraceae bacterium]|nr:dihydrolipoamide acetyltransferase family protein [Steroidobacteraceae bacterium]